MLALGAVLAWSLINLQVWYDPGPRLLLSEPAGIMGTSCRLVAETTLSDSSTTSATLSRAEAELRRLEAIFSTWIDSSVVSRFNQAAAGGTVAVPPEVLTVLAAAREAYQASEGAFDITCRPQLELWKQAVKTGQLPSAADREQARAASNWSQLGIQDLGLSKQVASMCIDLGGLAKGYAIDQAAACLLADGCVGVLDVGGDVRCLGQRSDGRAWPVQIRDPFGDGLLQGLLVQTAQIGRAHV
jgi:FAD:protein FMN transferase